VAQSERLRAPLVELLRVLADGGVTVGTDVGNDVTDDGLDLVVAGDRLVDRVGLLQIGGLNPDGVSGDLLV